MQNRAILYLLVFRILFESVTTAIMGLIAEEHEKERETVEADENAIES